MRPPKSGFFGNKMINGTAGATAGMATGTLVGATRVGGAITTASAGAVGAASSTLSGIAASASSMGAVGSAVGTVASCGATAITTVASGATALGSSVGSVLVATAPITIPLAVGYGLYKIAKWITD